MNRKLVVILLVLIISTALFFKVRSGLPIVRGEGQTLTWEDYSRHKAGLMKFRDLSRENVSDEDIEKGVILTFAKDSVIRKELENRGKREDDVRRVISENIDDEELKNLEDATSQLYGWTVADFEKYILLPQARESLLLEEIEDSGEDPMTWLDKSMSEASMAIYLFSWQWEGGEVIERF